MKSSDKLFRIIDLLKENREMKLQEIADALGMYKSTVHRIASELCGYDYLTRDAETKKYRLGMRFVDISSHIIDNMDIRELARKTIKELSEITNQAIHLAMLIDKQVIYIDKMESPHAIRMYSRIGKVAPLFCTGVGKAILAFQSPEVIHEMLDGLTFHKYTRATIVSREKLLQELAEIRKNGYALDKGEHERDVACLAVPLRDYTRKVIASVSITAILYQIRMEKLLEYRCLLLDKGRQISRNLGYKDLTEEQNPAPAKARGRGRSSQIKRVFRNIS